MQDNTCVCCGQIIPEGRQVYKACEQQPPEAFSDNAVKRIVMLTVKELQNRKLLKDVESAAYTEMSEQLLSYYSPFGKKDDALTNVLEQMKNDKYFHILTMFYKSKYTVEEIAEIIDVDVSTISRNKKRLCLEIYSRLNA